MQEKYLEALQKLLVDTETIKGEATLEGWKSTATNIVGIIYGNNSAAVENIKNLKYRPGFNGSNNVVVRKHQAKKIIEGIVYQITALGLPEKEVKSVGRENISISLTQNQHQETKINIDVVLSAIKDELTGKQLKEVQEVIDQDAPIEEKRSKIIEKLKSFGSDVASNIVATLLTNPQILG
jgi:hypothetical protein